MSHCMQLQEVAGRARQEGLVKLPYESSFMSCKKLRPSAQSKYVKRAHNGFGANQRHTCPQLGKLGALGFLRTAYKII
jgi:hypothetical protein